jgi:predicted AAA+ superfamily ATPase
MESTSRFFREPEGSFLLLGPRGTGKTWWARKHYPDALWVDLLDPATLRELSARPERLEEQASANPKVLDIVIDEVQKLPELLEVVHRLIEQKKERRFILTGSSARKLRRGGVNLLGGRAVQRSMHPFMASELGKRFDLATALQQGMLPLVFSASDPTDTLRAYNGLYLREEVLAEGLVRNVGGFSRFLEAISFSQAAPLNLASVSRECQVNRKTLEGHLEILEDLLLCFRLPVFTRRAKRAMASHPKFFFFDAGVFRSLRPSGPLDRSEEIDGAALETLVGQHLRAWCENSEGDHQLYYWQTRTQMEVDFVIYGPSGLYALEVKNAARVRNEELRPLQAFGEDYPESRRILLYRGKERFLSKEVLCMPCENFLRALIPNQFPE